MISYRISSVKWTIEVCSKGRKNFSNENHGYREQYVKIKLSVLLYNQPIVGLGPGTWFKYFFRGPLRTNRNIFPDCSSLYLILTLTLRGLGVSRIHKRSSICLLDHSELFRLILTLVPINYRYRILHFPIGASRTDS